MVHAKKSWVSLRKCFSHDRMKETATTSRDSVGNIYADVIADAGTHVTEEVAMVMPLEEDVKRSMRGERRRHDLQTGRVS